MVLGATVGLGNSPADPQELQQDFFNLIKADGVRTVTKRLFRFGMDFHKQAVDASCDGGTGQWGNELPLTAGRSTGPTGQLDGVGGVIYDRTTEGTHDWQGAHIDHEVVIAKTRTTFDQHDFRTTGPPQFVDGVLHVPGRNKLTFFDIDRFACASRCREQVGLAAEKGWNLKDIKYFGCGVDLGDIMDIRDDWYPNISPYSGKGGQAFLQSGTAVCLKGCTVGLVKRGLKDVTDAEPGADLLQGAGNPAGQFFRFEGTGAADEEQGLTATDKNRCSGRMINGDRWDCQLIHAVSWSRWR